MALEIQRRRFTAEEFHRMGEAGLFREDGRIELIDGEILMMTPIGPRHVYYVNRLTSVLIRAVGDLAIISPQNPVGIERRSEPQPDLVVLRARGRDYFNALPGKDDALLVVEVADSSLEYDRSVKMPLYANAGIPESWLLDVDACVIERCTEPGPDGYARIERCGAEGRITLVALPSVTIDLASILG